MTDRSRSTFCVIGGGSGGLSSRRARRSWVKAGAASILRTARRSATCLNYGCVPSKSVLAAAARPRGDQRGAEIRHHHAEPEVAYRAPVRRPRARRDRRHRLPTRVGRCASPRLGASVRASREAARVTGPPRSVRSTRHPDVMRPCRRILSFSPRAPGRQPPCCRIRPQ